MPVDYEVLEKEEEIEFIVEAPGVEKEKINLVFGKNELKITFLNWKKIPIELKIPIDSNKYDIRSAFCRLISGLLFIHIPKLISNTDFFKISII